MEFRFKVYQCMNRIICFDWKWLLACMRVAYIIWRKDGVCAAFTRKVTSASLQSVNDVGYGNRGKTWKKKKRSMCVRWHSSRWQKKGREWVLPASIFQAGYMVVRARRRQPLHRPSFSYIYPESSWTTLQQQKLWMCARRASCLFIYVFFSIS